MTMALLMSLLVFILSFLLRSIRAGGAGKIEEAEYDLTGQTGSHLYMVRIHDRGAEFIHC